MPNLSIHEAHARILSITAKMDTKGEDLEKSEDFDVSMQGTQLRVYSRTLEWAADSMAGIIREPRFYERPCRCYAPFVEPKTSDLEAER